MQISPKYKIYSTPASTGDASEKGADLKSKPKKGSSLFSRLFSKGAASKPEPQAVSPKPAETLKSGPTAELFSDDPPDVFDTKTSPIYVVLTENGKTNTFNLKDEPEDLLNLDPTKLTPSEFEDWRSNVNLMVVNVFGMVPLRHHDGMSKESYEAYNAVRTLSPHTISDAVKVGRTGVTVMLQDRLYRTPFNTFQPNVNKLAQIVHCVVEATVAHCPDLSPDKVALAFGEVDESDESDVSDHEDDLNGNGEPMASLAFEKKAQVVDEGSNWNDKPMASLANSGDVNTGDAKTGDAKAGSSKMS